MNISEANAVITVLRWALHLPGPTGHRTDAEYREYLVKTVGFLADRSHRATYAGVHPVEAEKAARALLAARPAGEAADEAAGESVGLAGWQAAAAQGVVDVLDTRSLIVGGTVWAVDATDADGDPAGPGEVFLITEDGGRQVTVRVRVELVEGALS